MCNKAMCNNCGLGEVRTLGRCKTCYRYFWVHGFDRSKELIKAWEKPRAKTCVNCGYRGHEFCRGRCRRCYEYIRAHGVDRPNTVHLATCIICNNAKPYAKGRCENCHRYHKRHGKERPRHWWDKDATCKTCSVPLSTVKQCNGYCYPCYKFYQVGKERPRHLWGIGAHGWCACGYPAEHQIDKMPLCNRCVVEYQKGAYS